MTNMIGAMDALSVLLSGVAARSADGRNFAHHPLLFLFSYFPSRLTSGLAFVDFGRPSIIRRSCQVILGYSIICGVLILSCMMNHGDHFRAQVFLA